MSLINGIKRAFGFSSDDDYDDYDDEVEVEKVDVKGVSEVKEVANVTEPIDNKAGGYDELADDLFDRLIEMVNAPLPEMVRKCVDRDAQKRMMFNELGGVLRKFMDDSVAKSMCECGNKWDAERDALKKTIAELEHKNKECKIHAEEIENKGLSSERQRRAVNERCQDYEKRVVTLEAELEQLQLINKSLTNKVKVAQVKADDNEYYANEIDRLKGEIITLRKSAEQGVDSAAVADPAIEQELNAKVAELEQLNATLTEELAEVREKLRANLVELEGVQQELTEANAGLEIVQEIQVQLDKVEEMKASKDAKIAALNNKCSEAEAEKVALEQQIEGLNATIRDNLVMASAREEKLSSEISELKAKSVADVSHVAVKIDESPIEMDGDDLNININIDDIDPNNVDVSSTEKRKEPKRRAKAAKKEAVDPIAFDESAKSSKISAIDDSLENLDWLVPSPKSELKPAKTEVVEVEEKPSAHVEDNSLQMSLF